MRYPHQPQCQSSQAAPGRASAARHCPRRAEQGTSTYRLLELALVALDLALQLVNQVLHPCQVLPVFFSLQVPPTHSAGPQCWCEPPRPCSGSSCPSTSSPSGARALCSHQAHALWADPRVSHPQPRRCHQKGRRDTEPERSWNKPGPLPRRPQHQAQGPDWGFWLTSGAEKGESWAQMPAGPELYPVLPYLVG